MTRQTVSTIALFAFLAGSIPAAAAVPLHPLGNFGALPTWPKEMPAETAELVIHPPPDAILRPRRFDGRNDPASLRLLCLELNEAVEPDAAGLDAFRALVRQARYADALDAHRCYYFAKLKNPEEYGAYTQNLTGYRLKAGKEWVLGSAVTTQNGTPVWFQAGPRTLNLLHAGPVQAEAEALLATRKDGIICGMVLGAEVLTIQGKSYVLVAPDAEFALDANGRFTSTAIRRPIDTVRISPDRSAFVDDLEISFDIPNRDTRDIEFRYTLAHTRSFPSEKPADSRHIFRERVA